MVIFHGYVKQPNGKWDIYGNPGIEKVGKLETMKSRSSINIQENLVYLFGGPQKNRNDWNKETTNNSSRIALPLDLQTCREDIFSWGWWRQSILDQPTTSW